MMNPLLQPFSNLHEAPPFELIKEEHFIPAIEQLIVEAEEKTELIASNTEKPNFENTIVALEETGVRLGIVANILFNLNHAETSEQLQQVAQAASPLFTEFSNRLLQNSRLFERVRLLYSHPHKFTNPEANTVLENWYRDFVRNGAMLNEEEKRRFAEIKTKLAKLTLEFADDVLAETNDYFLHLTNEADLAGLPDFVRESAEAEAKSRSVDGYGFTLHAPSYIPFMKYADRRDLREKVFRAFSFRSNRENEHDNKERIIEIVNLRLEMAVLLGEENYAAYRLKTKMAEEQTKVLDFLEKLHVAAQPITLKEFQEVQDFAKSMGADFDLQSWDWAYYSEKLKEQKYGFKEEMLKPYFELSRVIDGVFLVAERLYGITFREVSTDPRLRGDDSDTVKYIPVYHPDVKVYEVLDEDGTFLALLYADFHPRSGKQGGAWMTEFRSQSNITGKMVRPHISIVCNFSKPAGNKPSLLTFDEVNTFLHEFGHALHGMLSKVTYPSVSGTSVFQDFVELPSQIMENWMVEKEWLDLFAEHYETGVKIPQDLLDKLINARNFLEGYATVRQLGFGFCDMAWHSITKPFEGDVIEFEKVTTEKTKLFPRIEGAGFSPAFSHIFAGGYAAGYYGYKWAEVLDADAFTKFSQMGIFNREVATSFRKNILEKGGSEHPMVLYKRFKGDEPSVDALLKRSGLVNF